MKKKFMCMLMAAAMTLSMAACGPRAMTPTPTTMLAAHPRRCPDLYGRHLRPADRRQRDLRYGRQVRGVELAVNEINASDSTIKFEFLSQDDEADGEKAVNAYNNMMDNGMQVLVGPTTTGASIAVADACYTDRTFMLTPSASSTDVTAGKDNVFQVCFTDPNQGVGAADYMAENFADAKIAVIYRNDDAYSQGIRDAFVKEAGDKGLSIVYQGTFTLDTSSNFSVQLAAAQTAGADLVFLPIYYQPASVIFAQAKAMGYAPTFFGVDGMDGILDMPGFDTTLAEGLMLMTPFCATVESNQGFVDAYTAAYGTTPNQFAADAYDGVYIVKAALEQAGCTADMSNEEICDALVSAPSPPSSSPASPVPT